MLYYVHFVEFALVYDLDALLRATFEKGTSPKFEKIFMNIKNKSKGQAQLESNIENGVQNQLISLNKDKTRITYYVQQPYSTNPEEQVRAACFCALVLHYQYPADPIQFEIQTKPDKDRIDLLVTQKALSCR